MIVETKRLSLHVYTRFAHITEKHGNKKLKIQLAPHNEGILWVTHMNITGSEHCSSIGAKYMCLMEPELNRVYRLHGHRIIG